MSAIEMTTEGNVARVREYVDSVWSQGDLSAGDACIAENFVNPDNDILGPAGARQWAQRWRRAFPNQHKTFDLLFGVDNFVVAVFTEQGCHLGELFGLRPTGVNAVWQVIAIFEMESARIARLWVQGDTYGLLQQLGALPPIDQLAHENTG